MARPAGAADVPVSTPAGLLAAVSAAHPGDRIVLADGTYSFNASVVCSAAGTAAQPITVAAEHALGARIEFNTLEGFRVSGANWHFEGLDIHGVCADDNDCEHAFHITGAADGYVIRGNRVVDFNAQIKVNAAAVGGVNEAPDDGLVEYNEFFDTHVRQTADPVTKVNIDSGDRIVVRGNYIHDFAKGGADGISYGSFLKSGGRGGLYERNLVVCQQSFTGGTRIGLSFGGGGTGAQYCAPAYDAGVPCDPEHTDGIMRNNIIASCSDVGIYLNKAANTKLLFNTLIATSGIDFRYPSSTGIAVGNVLAGSIHQRDGATFTGTDNLINVTTFGAMYQAPAVGDLRLKGDVSALLGQAAARVDVPDDYCGRTRTAPYDLGALQSSLGDCDTVPPPVAVAQDGGPTDAGPADAGPADAGVTNEPDAGPSDAGNAGTPDSGAPQLDGGQSSADAGSGAAEVSGGCGCGTGSRGAPVGWGLVIAAVLAFRRRARAA